MRLVRGFTIPLIVVVLVFGVIVGVIGNFQLFPKVVILPVPIPIPPQLSKLYDTADWNKYHLRGNFPSASFLYPPDWTLEEKKTVVILKGNQGQVEILGTDLGFKPSPGNLLEQKNITLKLKKEKIQGQEFVYSSFTYSRNGFITTEKELGDEACLCILASYEGLESRGLILSILETLEIKER